MKCYRKNGSDADRAGAGQEQRGPSMKCYRKNGSDSKSTIQSLDIESLNEVLPKER